MVNAFFGTLNSMNFYVIPSKDNFIWIKSLGFEGASRFYHSFASYP